MSPALSGSARPQAAHPGPPDAAWLPAVERRLGRSLTVTGREPLAGGYHGGVVRVDLDGAAPVVVKRARPAEVAAMRALAVVREVEHPRLLAAGADWIVTPFYDGAPLPEGPDVSDGLWTTLARVHAHWIGRRPRGLPVTAAASCSPDYLARRPRTSRRPQHARRGRRVREVRPAVRRLGRARAALAGAAGRAGLC